MKALGANSYRLSLEWSRVQPHSSRWDERAWAHYCKEIDRLREARIEPMVTLHHFTVPNWLEGGVLAPSFPDRFGCFAHEAARRLGRSVTLWCTINEPNVLIYNGFIDGIWPPGVKDGWKAFDAFVNLLRAHAASATAVRAGTKGAKIGAAVHLRVFDPFRPWLPPDRFLSQLAARLFNWLFYDSITRGGIRISLGGRTILDEAIPELRSSVDWFGVNYYTRDLVRCIPRWPLFQRTYGPGPKNDLGWEIYPDGLLQVLRDAHSRYHLPIYVTENGIADRQGSKRAAFLRAHVEAIAQATREGIPVRGYFHWSLMDNFEWNDGFAPRYGLLSVDCKTTALNRSPAGGYETFAVLAKNASLLSRRLEGCTAETRQ
jgi:beta-glucosidase